ncbi:MAG TPA: hypothetical protein V6C78_26420 [Crinalium sp.]|jgi:hypothetical protein
MSHLANTLTLRQQVYQLDRDRISDTLGAAALGWLLGNGGNAAGTSMPIRGFWGLDILSIGILSICLIGQWMIGQQSGRYSVRTTVPISV